ncbi:hypothetical protein GCM10027340_10100 [Marinomonas epiphytica]
MGRVWRPNNKKLRSTKQKERIYPPTKRSLGASFGYEIMAAKVSYS